MGNGAFHKRWLFRNRGNVNQKEKSVATAFMATERLLDDVWGAAGGCSG